LVRTFSSVNLSCDWAAAPLPLVTSYSSLSDDCDQEEGINPSWMLLVQGSHYPPQISFAPFDDYSGAVGPALVDENTAFFGTPPTPGIRFASTKSCLYVAAMNTGLPESGRLAISQLSVTTSPQFWPPKLLKQVSTSFKSTSYSISATIDGRFIFVLADNVLQRFYVSNC